MNELLNVVVGIGSGALVGFFVQVFIGARMKANKEQDREVRLAADLARIEGKIVLVFSKIETFDGSLSRIDERISLLERRGLEILPKERMQ